MTEETKTRIPAPLVAAAGAGELAYEKLRQLPAAVTELRDKAEATAVELRDKAEATAVELRARATAGFKAANGRAADLQKRAVAELDADRLREVALRNRDAILAGAHKAQERANEMYVQLVARGERVVGSGATATKGEGSSAAKLQAGTPKKVAEPGDHASGSAKVVRPAKRTTGPA